MSSPTDSAEDDGRHRGRIGRWSIRTLLPPEVAVRGAANGLLAGMVFAALGMWFMATQQIPMKLQLMIFSSIVQGEHAMVTGAANPVVGMVVHLVLSMAYGVIFLAVVRRLRLRPVLVVPAGIAYGLVLYLVNFAILAPAFFPIFTKLNQPFLVINHVLYGVLMTLAVFSWRRPAHADPDPDADL